MSKGRYHLFSNLIYILEKEMATHSSILAWRILWTEEPGGLLSMGSHSGTWLKWLSMHACTGEGNGNPLQCSCLENPRDGGAWWAAVYGVAQSRTRLKRLSSSSSSNLYPVSFVIFLLYFTTLNKLGASATIFSSKTELCFPESPFLQGFGLEFINERNSQEICKVKMKQNKRSTVAFPTCLPLKIEIIGDIISESLKNCSSFLVRWR